MMRLVDDAMKEMDELRSAEAQRMDQTRKEYEAEVRGLKKQVARSAREISFRKIVSSRLYVGKLRPESLFGFSAFVLRSEKWYQKLAP